MNPQTPPKTPVRKRTARHDDAMPDAEDRSSGAATPPGTPLQHMEVEGRTPFAEPRSTGAVTPPDTPRQRKEEEGRTTPYAGPDSPTSASPPPPLVQSDLDRPLAHAEKELLAFAAHNLGNPSNLLVICPKTHVPLVHVLSEIALYFECGIGSATCDFVPMTDGPSYTTQEILRDRLHVDHTQTGTAEQQSRDATSTHPLAPATYTRVVCFGLPLLLASDRVTALLRDWKRLIRSGLYPHAQLVLELEWGRETSWEAVATKYQALAAGTGMDLVLINSRRLHDDSAGGDEMYHRYMYGMSYGNLAAKLDHLPNPSENLRGFIKDMEKQQRLINSGKFRKDNKFMQPGDKLYGRFELSR
ncbi:hypothetical protein SLS60_007539 [Paraconiothyrium brasiliense]|uniref:Uncharacterized protein n=1 Tax=Paraconiothyrium brasiliense TaxID=300254 RepID=A0ABR3R5M7_9PLEO